jgi:hypothetical protein
MLAPAKMEKVQTCPQRANQGCKEIAAKLWHSKN